MAHNFNTIEGTEVFNVNDAVQGSHALTLDDVKNFVSSGADKFHTNIVGTAPYDPLNPLTGWVAPTAPITGNTVEVKFTDGTISNYTFDGSVWGLDYAVIPTPAILTTVTGGTGLPNTATFNNGIDPPTVFNYIEGARHDLRLTSPIIERGSDSPTDAKGAQFLHDSYSHLNGYSDNWIGLNAGNRPSFKISDNGDFISGDLLGNNNVRQLFWDESKATLHFGKRGTNSLTGNYSLVGGENTTLIGNNNVLVGGIDNYLDGYASVLVGGRENVCRGNYSFIGSGFSNSTSNNYAYQTIGGGIFNESTNDYTTISGGGLNKVFSYQSTIGGGYNNRINSGSPESTIVGGVGNIINNPLCTIVGSGNTCNGYNSVIFGATNSTTNGTQSFVLGGNSFTTNAFSQVAIGNAPVIFTTNQTPTTQQNLNVILEVGNSSNNSTHRSNVLTCMASGLTQINHNFGVSSNQDDVTPASALEIVSKTSGLLMPRLTSTEITAWQASFNNTTDVTGLGGAGNEHHSRQGEMVYNLTTSQNVQARWNGTAWVFTTW